MPTVTDMHLPMRKRPTQILLSWLHRLRSTLNQKKKTLVTYLLLIGAETEGLRISGGIVGEVFYMYESIFDRRHGRTIGKDEFSKVRMISKTKKVIGKVAFLDRQI